MEKKTERRPSLWQPFRAFPSLFDMEQDLFPEMASFTKERGLSVSEDDGSIYVEASVPGLNPENIEVSLDNGTLWIKGEKEESEEDKARKYYRKASQSYSYCVTLPETYDASTEPEAHCENGIVRITFKKAAASEPRKIQVRKQGS